MFNVVGTGILVSTWMLVIIFYLFFYVTYRLSRLTYALHLRLAIISLALHVLLLSVAILGLIKD